MAPTSHQSKTARKREAKHPKRDIVTPPEPVGEDLAEIRQMAEDSALRSMDKIRVKMEKDIREALETKHIREV